MDQGEQIEVFHSALVAFEIRFERSLDTQWEQRERESSLAICCTPTTEKYKPFQQFFANVQADLETVIHEYFPSLLQIANANRYFLLDRSPLAWTQSEVLSQVCNFLAVHVEGDEAGTPRDDSRVLMSAERITAENEWIESGPPKTFLLPRWTKVPHPIELLFLSAEEKDIFQSKLEKETLSRTETLEWAKHRQFWLRRAIERQIDNEALDGMIEAGKNRYLVPSADRSVIATASTRQIDTRFSETRLENTFVRESDNRWTIIYAGEKCKFPHCVGLDYISLLVQAAGTSYQALMLQHLATGNTFSKQDYQEPFKDNSFQGNTLDASLPADGQISDAIVDDVTIRHCKTRLKQLEEQIARGREIGDDPQIHALEKESHEISSYLNSSRNRRGRSRNFPDHREKARQSITKALDRAYDLIGKDLPAAAAHFKSQIRKGSEFVYLDCNTQWHLRRHLKPGHRP